MTRHELSNDHWLGLLARLHEERVADVNRALTNDPAIQGWLQERAQSAAMGLYGEADVGAISEAYADLLANFQRQFSGLAEAVDQATDGLAEADVQWDPLSPHLSGIRLRFRAPMPIHVFRRLPEIEEGEIARMFDELVAYLPDSQPYRGHPHILNVLLAYRGRSLPLQIIDETQERHRMRAVEFHPEEVRSRGRLALQAAPAAVSEYYARK